MKRSLLDRRLVALCGALFVLGLSGAPRADAFSDFEAPGFTPGESVHNHGTDGIDRSQTIDSRNGRERVWLVPTVGTDEAVVDLTAIPEQSGLDAKGHGKVWRLSPAFGGGLEERGPYSPSNVEISGERASLPQDARGPSTTQRYYARFDFRSATGASQPGMQFLVAASSGESRQAAVRIEDSGRGLDLSYSSTANGCASVLESVATGLSYEDWHTLAIDIVFVDGLGSGSSGVLGASGNDVVRIYVDGALALTSTTWESCVGARVVDQVLFGTEDEHPRFAGGGLFFDNVLVTGAPPPATVVALADASTCEGGADAVVRVTIDTDGDLFQSLDVQHLFDDDNLALSGVFKTDVTLGDDYVVFFNALPSIGPDTLDLALFTGTPAASAPGDDVLWLLFRSTGAVGTYPLSLISSGTQINEQVASLQVDGSVTVGSADVRLAIEDSASGAPGSIVNVPLYADPSSDLNAFDFDVFFNPSVIQAIGAQTTAATAGFTVTTNLLTPGRALISLFSATPLPAIAGQVAVGEIIFQVTGSLGNATALDIATGLTDDGYSTCLDDGWFEVCPDDDNDGVTACPGDSDDCDDSNPFNIPPVVGPSLELDKSPVDIADLAWTDGGVPGPFRLYRGFRDTESPFVYNHVCLGPPIPGTTVSDADVPVLERTFYYLISREGPCGESGLGFDSAGIARPNVDPCASVFVDTDGDGTAEALDNCPGLFNPTQSDGDGDGNGDDCDNCIGAFNPDQADLDQDGDGDVCDPDDDDDMAFDGVDNCPRLANPLQENFDGDLSGDVCDNCPLESNSPQNDLDGDGVGDTCDNCTSDFNPGQEDGDSDDIGDVCDPTP